MHRLAAVFLLLSSLIGCAANPVTGESELHLISESQEIAIGEENYLAGQQAAGGTYKVDPRLTEYVDAIGQRLVAVSDRPGLPYEFVVLNDSTPNAWAMPGGKIAINRGLLIELESEAELAAVLAHEIVHAAARHSAHAMEQGMLMNLGVLAVGMAAEGERYGDLLVGAASVGAGLLGLKYGRDDEREADLYGIRYMIRAGYDPQAAVRLQETFVRLFEQRRPGWLDGMLASHPPSRERVENNRRLVAELGNPGGKVGREEYQARIAHLERTRPAYEAAEAGRKALEKGDARAALRQAEMALETEPREALFWGLKGDALAELGQERPALRAYDAAVARNGEYFAFYLKRGELYRRLGQRERAQADLERSTRLLPTAPAHLALADLALGSGNRRGAVDNLRVAAESDSSVGRQAGEKLARLELSAHPERYLSTALGRDDGRVMARVVNRSPVAVSGIVLELQSGNDRRQLRVPGTLAPGASVVVNTGVTAISGKEFRRLQAEVVRAAIAR